MYEKMFELHAELLKAIAHPRRLEIMQLLRRGSLPVTEMYTMLDLPQANISQHLQILRKAGVVKTQRKGKQMYYSIAHRNYVKASDFIRDVLIKTHKNDPLIKEMKYSMDRLVPVVHDPVCTMRISPKTAAFSSLYNGEQYYFCASGCYQQFLQKPRRYTI